MPAKLRFCLIAAGVVVGILAVSVLLTLRAEPDDESAANIELLSDDSGAFVDSVQQAMQELSVSGEQPTGSLLTPGEIGFDDMATEGNALFEHQTIAGASDRVGEESLELSLEPEAQINLLESSSLVDDAIKDLSNTEEATVFVIPDPLASPTEN